MRKDKRIMPSSSHPKGYRSARPGLKDKAVLSQEKINKGCELGTRSRLGSLAVEKESGAASLSLTEGSSIKGACEKI